MTGNSSADTDGSEPSRETGNSSADTDGSEPSRETGNSCADIEGSGLFREKVHKNQEVSREAGFVTVERRCPV